MCILTLYLFVLCAAAVSPTITQANDDSVDLSPLLLAGESVNLTCTAIGTPRPQIRWYRGKHRILTSSRAQIIETEIDSTTLQSMLNISSAEVDSGTYECHVENELGTTALQFQVVIGKCFICAYIVVYTAFVCADIL